MTAPAICTIVAKNYMAHARCLMNSFLDQHPDGRGFVLLMDEPDPRLPLTREQFTVIPAREIGLPNYGALTFRYNVLELCTAVKPFFLAYLFKTYGCERLCYFDPDIVIYSRLAELEAALESSTVVLTPHILAPIDEDGYRPNDLDILVSGAYNLGFIGLRRHAEVDGFLTWWQKKLLKYAASDINRGLFTDQRWIDVAAAMLPHVHVLRHPGYNVAYWNMSQRRVRQSGSGYTVNGEELRFFHYSGFSVEKPDEVSKYQTRFRLSDLGDAAALYQDYRQRLVRAGYHQVKDLPYAYNFFDDGVPVPALVRSIYRDYDSDGARWPQPFATKQPGNFRAWLNEPADEVVPGRVVITRLALEILRYWADARRVFVRPLNEDRQSLANWVRNVAAKQMNLPPCFLEPLQISAPSSRRYALLPLPVGPLGALGSQARLAGLRRSADGEEARPGPLAFLPVDQDALLPAGDDMPAVAPAPTNWAPKPTAKSAAVRTRGINVVGYLRSETGVGEICRAMMRTLTHHNYPAAFTSLERHDRARQFDESLSAWREGHPFDINLFHVNADSVPVVISELGPEFFAAKYNIGYWFWELSRFPDNWEDRFAHFQELWVATSFVQTTLAAVSPIPVVRIRPYLAIPPVGNLSRSALGVPADRFTFLFVFDMLSVCERKNPLGLMAAYERAFGKKNKDTALVLKMTNGSKSPDNQKRVMEEAERLGAIVIDRYLNRPELYALMKVCDAYVSLHRSEGFGLTLAEAMLLGKPVIATAYSANMDFMTPSNSYLVKYRLVELDQDYPPYKKGEGWADPDLEDAATLMRRVYQNRSEAATVGALAAADVRTMYGIHAAGADVLGRLDRITGACGT